jgi:hypothetical protein
LIVGDGLAKFNTAGKSIKVHWSSYLCPTHP